MLVIDRIEDGIAVIESGEETVLLHADALPQGAREGDVITRNAQGGFDIDSEATLKRRAAMRARLDRFKRRTPKED